tara:strand:+ start:157 stop:354 length:198 start_codon:yes stop_codon:yes gene_type:complete
MRIVVFLILCFIGMLVLLLLPKREFSDLEKTKMWKPRDFYLVYQYYFDADILELRKEYESSLKDL